MDEAQAKENKKNKEHLSVTTSTFVFMLLTHGNYIAEWAIYACWAVVLGLLMLSHAMYRRK